MATRTTVSGIGQAPSLAIHAGSALLVFHSDGRVTTSSDLKPEGLAAEVVALFLRHGWLRYAPSADSLEAMAANGDPNAAMYLNAGGVAAPQSDRIVTGGLRESGKAA